MFAFPPVRVGEHAQHGLLLENRDGAGNESTGSNFAGHGEKDHVGGRRPRSIGISDRQMRRWRERYEEFGYDGLFDRRRGQPSPKRVPVQTVEQVLGLYREEYFDYNVRHFHEKLGAEHALCLAPAG